MALDPTRKQRLRAQLVGKTLHDVPTPSVVLDLAKVTTNCERMLEATKRLGLLWRAHVKTHKTLELTRLQVGDTGPVSLIGSTVTDVENLLPLVKEYQSSNRRANVLLGFPLFPSAVPRLRTFLSQAGPGSLSVLIDNPAQLASVSALAFGLSPVPIFLKIDAGYGRAGVVPSSPACAELIDAALAAETSGDAILHGIYCHAGHSYALRETWSAMDYLADEFGGLAGVAKLIRSKSPGHDLVLSVGATPTATAIQHPLFSSSGGKDGGTDAPATATTVQNQLAELKAEGFQLEVHAGVYPTLDLQQLATHARDASLMTADDIAISVLAEVASGMSPPPPLNPTLPTQQKQETSTKKKKSTPPEAKPQQQKP
ncbi:D-serine dehydratase [Echria macrotheca]|uniref:D-serine dehydratase n=1 Tax=Echria macrotheca TaxID=438768 RepID=A0AAJ0F7Y1_9PEZI|nr:D-serine dehydratase [Echria macrotheca]